MGKTDRELCLNEITSDVVDSLKTVNITLLSENWGFTLQESSDLLVEWIKENGTDKTFYKQFLVRYVGDDGTLFLMVVPEEKVKSLTEKYPDIFQMLYSINEGSEPSPITISSFREAKRKRLVLPQSGAKRVALNYKHETTDAPVTNGIKQETSSASSKQTNGHSSNAITTMFKNVKSEPKSPAKSQIQANKEKITPKKSPPKKKEVAKKAGSIGSFFAAKPKTQSANSSTEKEEKNAKSPEIKQEVKIEEKTPTENAKRSPGSNDHSENDENRKSISSENPPKRRKVEERKKVRAKGSRIMVLADSDEDEEVESKPDDKVESEEQEEPSEENVQGNKTTVASEPVANIPKTGRSKKRRMVTKTYEDEDGFIKTVKESEEYSCSEPEDNEPAVKVKKEEVNSKQEDKKKTKTSPTTTAKVPRKPASKQGSIMSFFSKK